MSENKDDNPFSVLPKPESSPSSLLLQAAEPSALHQELLDTLVQKDQEDPNIQFKIVSDRAEHILTLKEVEDQVGRDQSIDVARAVVVNETFGHLFDSSVSKNGFSMLPTKANYAETCRYMRSVIAKEEGALVDLFKTYLDEPFRRSLELLKHTDTVVFTGLVSTIESLLSEVRTQREKVLNNHNRVVPMGDRFVDLTTVDLLSLEVASIRTTLKSVNTFRSAIQAIQGALRCKVAKRAFCHVLQKEEIDESGAFTVSFSDLLAFILSERLIPELTLHREKATRCAERVGPLVQQARELSDKPERLTSFVVEHTPLFLSYHKTLTQYSEVVVHLTLLTLSIKELLVTYYEL